MQDPRIVAVACRRCLVIGPARVMLQCTVIPAFEVEGRICHDVVEVQPLMQIIQKAGVTGFPQVMADTAQCQVHFGKAIGGWLFLLSVYIDTVEIPLFGLDKGSVKW